MMLTALIIDDERLARYEMSTLVKDYKTIKIIGEASNADQALEIINKEKPDVLFLDIQMPGKSGFELIEMLDYVPKVIFTTAYEEYAIKAFEKNAFDYLLKPIQSERFEESMKKLLSEIKSKPFQSKQEKLSLDNQIFVKDGNRYWFVTLLEVKYFESDGNYVKVYFKNNHPMIHKSLNALDEKLDPKYFFRVSRRFIVNLKWIDSIEPWFNGGLMVKIKEGGKIEVSRRQAVKFRERMSL